MEPRLRIGALPALLLGLLFLSQPVIHAQEPTGSDAESQVQALLLDGVRAFRAEQFESALQIFYRVERLGPRADLGMYRGMALHKLGRHAEALTEFRAARRAGISESVADYYDAVSCYRLGLHQRARDGFAALLDPPTHKGSPPLGPRLREGAARFVAALDRIAPRNPDPLRPETALSRRIELVQKQVSEATQRRSVEAEEWLEELALLLQMLPMEARNQYQPAFQERLNQIQQWHRREGAAGRVAELSELLERVRTAPTR